MQELGMLDPLTLTLGGTPSEATTMADGSTVIVAVESTASDPDYGRLPLGKLVALRVGADNGLSKVGDLEIRGGKPNRLLWRSSTELVVISDIGFSLIDVANPSDMRVTGDLAVRSELQYNRGAIKGGCLLQGKYLFLARGHPSGHCWIRSHDACFNFADSPFLGIARVSGMDVYDLTQFSGNLSDPNPAFRLATPWLTPSDCIARDDSSSVYAVGDYFGPYWPLYLELLMGLGIADYNNRLLNGIWLDHLTNPNGPEVEHRFALLNWQNYNHDSVYSDQASPSAEVDSESVTNEDERARRIVFLSGFRDVEPILNVYTLDAYAPRDPPGPFALDWGALLPAGTYLDDPNALRRGDGPIFVDMSADPPAGDPDSIESIVGGILNSLGSGDMESALRGLLEKLAPYYCWIRNPLTENNDFADFSKQCVELLPRFGLEELVYESKITTDDVQSVDFIGGLTELHTAVLVGAGLNPAAAELLAPTVASYNMQLLREYTYWFNRVSGPLVGTNHRIDFSEAARARLGSLRAPPTAAQSTAVFDGVLLSLQSALSLELGGGPSTAPEAAIPAGLGDDFAPIDFGQNYAYPHETANDPTVGKFYPQRVGDGVKMWGTEGLTIESRLMGVAQHAREIPDSPYWLSWNPGTSWHVMNAADGKLDHVLTIGDALSGSVEFGDASSRSAVLPLRYERQYSSLAGYSDDYPVGATAVSGDAILLLSDNYLTLMDLTPIAKGNEPLQVWRQPLPVVGDPAAKANGPVAVLPGKGLILVFSYNAPDTDSVVFRVQSGEPF